MNYFLGRDASKWYANVPSYGSLRWEGAYPGLNLVFGRSGAGLGLTVESANDAALAGLRLRIEGADTIRVDATGRLVADTAIGPIALPPLLTGEGTPLHPEVTADGISFAAYPFNPFPQSVDSLPANDSTDLLYSTYLGGSDLEESLDIALGLDNSVYVTGYTYSNDFPITPGAFDPTCGTDGNCSYTYGRDDAFVSHLSADGSTLLYSTYLGGNNQERGDGIAVDAAGSAYVTGYTWSSDFPTTSGAFQPVCGGNCSNIDAFVTKLSADGSTLVYSTFLGGGKQETGYDVALGADGTAYVTGDTASRDFPITPDAYDPTCGTDGRCNPYSFTQHYDAFVTHLNAAGSGLVYSTFLGGSEDDCFEGCHIALGGDNAMYLTGNTCSTDFPTTPNAYDTSFNGASDGCVLSQEGDVYAAKLSADGSTLEYSTYLGGSSDEWGVGIAVRADDTAYLTGATSSSDFPTTSGAFQTACAGSLYCEDGFVTRVSADGSGLLYSTYLGGDQLDYGAGIAVGEDGAAYVDSFTASFDFPTTPGAYDLTCGTDGLCNYDGTVYYPDAALTKLTADGSGLVYSTFFGGAECETGDGLALLPDGSAYIIGQTCSTDLPTTPGAFDTSFNGHADVFIARLSPDLVRLYVADISPTYRPRGGRYLVGARITIRDINSAPVSGAAVTVNITPPSGNERTFTNTTNTSGRVIFRSLVRDTGTYTFTVTNVTNYGWLYDPSLNVETSDSIIIP